MSEGTPPSTPSPPPAQEGSELSQPPTPRLFPDYESPPPSPPPPAPPDDEADAAQNGANDEEGNTNLHVLQGRPREASGKWKGREQCGTDQMRCRCRRSSAAPQGNAPLQSWRTFSLGPGGEDKTAESSESREKRQSSRHGAGCGGARGETSGREEEGPASPAVNVMDFRLHLLANTLSFCHQRRMLSFRAPQAKSRRKAQ